MKYLFEYFLTISQSNRRSSQHKVTSLVCGASEQLLLLILREKKKLLVFHSFRRYTRFTFTGHLYNALRLKRFKTFFYDDEGLNTHDQISLSINKGIEQSKISIVVLCINYAFSTWRLNELVNILECKKKNHQQVWPVFYKVKPSDVRYQTGSYGEAMAKHEYTFGSDYEKVKKWRSALTQLSSFKGWDLVTGYEYEHLQNIVESVTQSLPSHDVFLSFRGLDTRHSFTGFLYDALWRKGLNTFMDDEGLEGGDQISASLLQAIEQSRASVIIFSENYAHSSWCLDELLKIMDCMKKKRQLIWPIYYKVQPSDVWHQRSSYSEAMTKHENRFGNDSEKVEKWKTALSEVANLEKWHFETGYEYEYIEKIVESVTVSLKHYDVILSFNGQDTCYTFTGYLYNALRHKGFKTFMDDGDQVSPSLLNAMEESRLSIIVFSENYACSSGCLDKLVNILRYKKMKNHLVWPIFYKVEPSDVRHQINSYGNAMAEHKSKLGNDSEKVSEWESALYEVSNLKGWPFKTGYEYEFVQKIVEMVSNT